MKNGLLINKFNAYQLTLVTYEVARNIATVAL